MRDTRILLPPLLGTDSAKNSYSMDQRRPEESKQLPRDSCQEQPAGSWVGKAAELLPRVERF